MMPTCAFDNPILLFISNSVPSVVYYSHVPAIAILLALLIILSKRLRVVPYALNLAFSIVPLIVWIALNIITFSSNRPDIIMFAWSIQILIEPLVYLGLLSFVYTFIKKRQISIVSLILGFLVYAPMLFIAPISLGSFDVTNCVPIENPISFYTYVVEILSTLGIIAVGIYHLRKQTQEIRHEGAYIIAGVILLLASFAWGNILGSMTSDWRIASLGVFGVPFFSGFLVYTTFKYNTFRIRLLSTELYAALFVLLVLVQFLFVESIEQRILSLIVFVSSIIISSLIVKNVVSETKAKDDLEFTNSSLVQANTALIDLNTQKDELLSFATHQLKTPLTGIKWGLESLADEVRSLTGNANALALLGQINSTNNQLIDTVSDFLDVSKLEQNAVMLSTEKFSLYDFVTKIGHEFDQSALHKGLQFHIETLGISPTVVADKTKVRQVLVNLIDNAIKYTDSGSVTVRSDVVTEDDKVNGGKKQYARISVIDTGHGMSDQEIPELFKKFSRGAAGKKIKGSGIGLYLAKKIIELHFGKVRALSPGVDKGSTFEILLPI